MKPDGIFGLTPTQAARLKAMMTSDVFALAVAIAEAQTPYPQGPRPTNHEQIYVSGFNDGYKGEQSMIAKLTELFNNPIRETKGGPDNEED